MPQVLLVRVDGVGRAQRGAAGGGKKAERRADEGAGNDVSDRFGDAKTNRKDTRISYAQSWLRILMELLVHAASQMRGNEVLDSFEVIGLWFKGTS